MTTHELDRGARLALRYQLEEQLRGLIRDLPVSAILPSERDLCAMADVSRTTVRAAVGALVDEGLLTRDHGRGTFVAPRKSNQVLTDLNSFTTELRSQGRRPGARLLAKGVVAAPRSVAEALGVDEGSDVVFIERLRLMDGVPVQLSRSHLPNDFAWLLDLPTPAASLWQEIKDRMGLTVVRAVQTLEMIALDHELAALLNEPAGAAAFLLRLTAFDASDQPIEYVSTIQIARLTRYTMELTARVAAELNEAPAVVASRPSKESK